MKQLKNVDLHADLARFDDALHKDGNIYVASLETPLVIATPPLLLDTPMAVDEEPAAFVKLKLPAHALDFFASVEGAVLEAALAHKATWFREDLGDDALRASFKSFLNADAKLLKVRVASDAVAFDAQRASTVLPAERGVRARAVLELSRIIFGKSEFAAVWKLKQIKLVDNKYLFDDEEVPAGIADTLEDEVILKHGDDDIAANVD